MNIIQQMTAGCERDDCAIASRNTGIGQTGSSSMFWYCQSCGREWSVTTYDRGPTFYDKHGVATHAAERPQKVTEITRQ